MSELVAFAATVHTPYITGWPERATDDDRARTFDGFAQLGAAFRAAEVETVVVVTSEHIVNLEPRMAPAFTVGIGDVHPAYPEPNFQLAPAQRRGDRALGLELVRGLYGAGFDPAHSVELQLDHGTVLPLSLMGLPDDVAIVPVLVNTLFHPLPTLERCRALGEQIALLVAASGHQGRVGMLATGGVSHTVGKPGPERNDPAFDRRFVEALVDGALERICDLSDRAIEAAGNGTHEIRNWIAVAAAAAPRPAQVVTAIPFAPGWDSGVYQLLWNAA